ncbi:MAG: DegQ family serine endoprotease [candidate division WOR-3 bacterium]|nr:MAG: DegQ family serine endoprotease [candidate division WOR-3 bacterium]
MCKNISFRNAGIIAGAAAVFAFLFGIIITASMPGLANRGEASQERGMAMPLVSELGESPFTLVADKVSPAVANISAERTVTSTVPGLEWRFEGPWDDLFKDFFRQGPRPEKRAQTLGSGFLISKDGYLVTNYHLIRGASDIVVKLINKQEFKGEKVKVIGTDPRTDIALLKIENGEDLPYLQFGDSEKIRVGDWAIAFGNPFHLEGTVTVGVISAKGRAGVALPEGPDFQSFLQTDAAINPGNSGGPLVNIHGEVIGINTAITSPSGGNVGIGFAIPASLAESVIEALKSEGKVTRGYLGVYLQEITEDIKEAMNLPSLEGVLISDVVDNTPASRAGIKAGDVITEFDGKPVREMASFRITVASTSIGKTVKIKVVRDGKPKELKVKIGEMPETPTRDEIPEQEHELGLRVIELSDPDAGPFQPSATKGVLVTDITSGTPADKAGFAVGDVIMAIGGKDTPNLAAYRKTVSELKKGKPVIFHVQRGERKLYIAVTP